MKHLIPLVLALSVLTACGEPAATTAEPAATTAAADNRAATSAAEPAAPASAPSPAATTPAPAASTSPAASAGNASSFAGQPATQTAPGIMTDPVAAAGFVEGEHFTRLSGAPVPAQTPGQVEVDEFFMYSCIHCYNLEPYVQAWLPNKPAHINFVRIPTTWNAGVRMHAQAFYAAAALGKGEEMHLPFFQSMHVDRNYLESPDELRQFFGRFGVSGDDFDSVFGSFSVVTQVNNADQIARRYGVDSTPTIIVAGKYRTGVGEAGSPERLFELIEALSLAELRR